MRHRKKHGYRKLLAACTAVLLPLGFAALSSPAEAVTPKAFPGAEGFGTDTPGGRGGTICQVTNLNNSGTGSLRACVEASGPRVVVFRTGGTINLTDRLLVTNPNLTILGHTAPGDGITLRMAPGSTTDKGTMQIETHDVVIRYVRFRPGDNGSGDDSHDGVQIYKAGVNNVVIDHSSVSWAIDENVNTYDYSTNITVSNSIIAEALSNSTHPEGEHSKGMLSGGVDAHNVSIHHNLFVSNVDRNPQVSGVSVADIRNNVVYNYGDGSGDGVTLISSSKGEPDINWISNYYKPGPDSSTSRAEFATYNGSTGSTHEWYGSGNMRWTSSGNQPARVASGAVGQRSTPFAVPTVTTQPANEAYELVLATAGASKVRDAVDTRLVNEVRNGTGSIKDSASGLYPTLDPGVPPADGDGDGLPDSWELTTGGTTPNGDHDGDGYTNIEEWAETLIPGNPTPDPDPTPDPNQAPVVDAGANQTVTLPADANLDGTVSDPDAGDTVTTTWSKVSGPGTVTFGNAGNVDTTAAFSAAGTYVLQLSGTDGEATTNDQTTVTVNAAPGPDPDPDPTPDPDPDPTPVEVEVWLNGPLSCPVVTDPAPGDTVTCTYR